MWLSIEGYSTKALLLATVLGVAACSQTPIMQSGTDAEVIDGNLYRVDNSTVDKFYIDPAVIVTDSTVITLEPLIMDDVEVEYDRSRMSLRASWELNERDKTELQGIFNKAFISNKRYIVADKAGSNILRLAVTLVKLEPNAPKDDLKSRPGRSTYITEGFGAMSIRVVITNSETGNVVAIMEDRKQTMGPMERNNKMHNQQDIYRMFVSWAGQISRGLMHFSAGKVAD